MLASVGFSVAPVLEGRYEVCSGVFDNGTGRTVDFIAATDPVPFVVLGGAVLIGGCAVLGGLERLAKKLEMRSSGHSAECKKLGRFPMVDVHFGLRFSLKERAFGCTFHPKPVCVGLDGSTVPLAGAGSVEQFDYLPEGKDAEP